LKPVSRGLDILQGEDSCFYGKLLPTLKTIVNKTIAKKSELLSAIVDYIDRAIRCRFGDNLDAIVAAVSSPKFKLSTREKGSVQTNAGG